MRNSLLFIVIAAVIVGCGKDKFTTNPQISYKSVDPNSVRSDIPNSDQLLPRITIHVTDSEGDLGIVPGSDTAYVFVKSLINNAVDSFIMPDIKSVVTKDFQGDIVITPPLSKSGRPAPKVDTLFYEIYVKDFKKNKSNVITTKDPIFFIVPR